MSRSKLVAVFYITQTRGRYAGTSVGTVSGEGYSTVEARRDANRKLRRMNLPTYEASKVVVRSFGKRLKK